MPPSTNKGIVTEDIPRNYHRPGVPSKNVIKVQPLKKDEMQPLYAQDLGLEAVTHGFYGSMMQALGSCVGFCGAVPCCPFPNPFKEVRQGTSLVLPSQPHGCLLHLLTNRVRLPRLRGTRLALRPILQSRRSRLGPGQRLHRSAAYRGRQDTNHFHRSADRHHSRQCQCRDVMSFLIFSYKAQTPPTATR